VLLSATCIEGFLRECLQSFENTLSSKDTFDKRLKHNYYERVSNATFGEMSKLFCLALGKPLSEIFKGQTILEQVAILFKFRNGIAHGRSLEYRSYSAYASEPSTWEFEAWGQYESVEEYLIKNKFISKTDEDVFSNEIADHFAGLIEPYIRCIVSVLPEEQSKSLRFRLRVAFSDKPSGNGKVLAGNQVSAITCITPSAPSGAESL
jgi:hypothetical protein